MTRDLPFRFREARSWPRSIVLWWKLPLVWKLFEFSRAPTMYVNDPEDDEEIEHEYGHVVWLWEKGFLRFYLGYLFVKSFKRDAECYSNARRIRKKILGGGFELDGLVSYWAATTAASYSFWHFWGYSFAECEQRIRHYYEELSHA